MQHKACWRKIGHLEHVTQVDNKRVSPILHCEPVIVFADLQARDIILEQECDGSHIRVCLQKHNQDT